MLYAIGEISSIVKISKDTLRYYDDVGILKPCKIDQANGYRYYSEEQIKTLNLILEYKSYGFSLEEIKQILTQKDSGILSSMLAKQHERMAEKHIAIQETMRRIQYKMNRLQGGEGMKDLKRKVLVVDDAPFMKTILTDILENNGYQPLVASSGEEALALYPKEQPELVLMDIEMPGMNGIVCTKKIKEIDPSARIMILSAYFHEENLDAAYAAGACYFQPKPFTHDVLLYCMQRIFDGTIEKAHAYANEWTEKYEMSRQ